MSLRTIPESSSTFGPLDPSPGKGPPVSSGTSVTPPAPVDSWVDGPDSPVQAASSAAAPIPPNSPSIRRRSTSVPMS